MYIYRYEHNITIGSTENKTYRRGRKKAEKGETRSRENPLKCQLR